MALRYHSSHTLSVLVCVLVCFLPNKTNKSLIVYTTTVIPAHSSVTVKFDQSPPLRQHLCEPGERLLAACCNELAVAGRESGPPSVRRCQ